MNEDNKFLKSEGKDEIYCEFFHCDKCENTLIRAGANYCDNCGQDVRIKMPV